MNTVPHTPAWDSFLANALTHMDTIGQPEMKIAIPFILDGEAHEFFGDSGIVERTVADTRIVHTPRRLSAPGEQEAADEVLDAMTAITGEPWMKLCGGPPTMGRMATEKPECYVEIEKAAAEKPECYVEIKKTSN